MWSIGRGLLEEEAQIVQRAVWSIGRNLPKNKAPEPVSVIMVFIYYLISALSLVLCSDLDCCNSSFFGRIKSKPWPYSSISVHDKLKSGFRIGEQGN